MTDWASDSKAVVANSLLVAAAEFAIGLLVCYLVQLVRFFRRRETAVGILCLLCLILGGGGLTLGIPVAIVFGWVKAGRWGIRTFMALFTGLFVAVVANIAAAMVVRFAITAEQWAKWFG